MCLVTHKVSKRQAMASGEKHVLALLVNGNLEGRSQGFHYGGCLANQIL